MEESNAGGVKPEESPATAPPDGGAEAPAPVAPSAPRKLDGILIALIIVSCIASALLGAAITLAVVRDRRPDLPDRRQEMMERWKERRGKVTPEERMERLERRFKDDTEDTQQDQAEEQPAPAPDQSP